MPKARAARHNGAKVRQQHLKPMHERSKTRRKLLDNAMADRQAVISLREEVPMWSMASLTVYVSSTALSKRSPTCSMDTGTAACRHTMEHVTEAHAVAAMPFNGQPYLVSAMPGALPRISRQLQVREQSMRTSADVVLICNPADGARTPWELSADQRRSWWQVFCRITPERECPSRRSLHRLVLLTTLHLIGGLQTLANVEQNQLHMNTRRETVTPSLPSRSASLRTACCICTCRPSMHFSD